MTSPSPSQDFLQQISHLAQEAEKRRAEIEQNQNLPSDLMESLKDTQIFRSWVAQQYGGKQDDIRKLLEAIQVLAYHQGSLAWVAMVCSTAGLCAGFLPEASAQKIFSDPHSMVGGLAAPVGRASREPGGIRVSGQWAWGSGTRHCSHIVGGLMLWEEATEKPRTALAFFKPEDVTFENNWQVMGLQGTHSVDYSVENVWVPDGEWLYFPVQKAYLDQTLYRFSFMGALASGVASVGLGLAQRALDEFKALATQKRPSGSRLSLAEKATVQAEMARAEAGFRAAKLFLEDSIDRAWEEAEKGTCSPKSKGLIRLAASHAAQASVNLVDTAYTLAGGSSIWDGVKLQEVFRDIHVMTQHAMVSPSNFETYGRLMMGQPVSHWVL